MIKRSYKTYKKLFIKAGFNIIHDRQASEISSIDGIDPDGCRVWLLHSNKKLYGDPKDIIKLDDKKPK